VCSEECKSRRAESVARGRARTTYGEVACRDCGALFERTPCGGLPKQICDACRLLKLREGRRMARDRRRLRVSALETAEVERIYRRKVFERDRWRCQLCGKPVKRTATVPDPKAPTLDHVVPLAVGGSHTYANVQCAHFLCNSLKSAGGGQQLAMFG
jgi:hypothetical protein